MDNALGGHRVGIAHPAIARNFRLLTPIAKRDDQLRASLEGVDMGRTVLPVGQVDDDLEPVNPENSRHVGMLT